MLEKGIFHHIMVQLLLPTPIIKYLKMEGKILLKDHLLHIAGLTKKQKKFPGTDGERQANIEVK